MADGAEPLNIAGNTLIAENIEHKNVHLALLAAQREFREIIRDKINRGGPDQNSYSYSSLAAVYDHVRPIVNRHGMTLNHEPKMVEIAGKPIYVMETLLTHAKSGKFRAAQYPLSTGVLPPRQMGSLMTYSQRYNSFALLGVTPEAEDDDAREARDVNASPEHIPSTFEDEPQRLPPGEGGASVVGALPPPRGGVLDTWLHECRTDDEIDKLLESERWNLHRRSDRDAMEPRIEAHRAKIAAAGGKLAPPTRRGDTPKAAPPEAANEGEDTDADAKLFAKLSLSLNRCKSLTALAEWERALSDGDLAQLTETERTLLQKARNAKRTALTNDPGPE